jgi:hypothetical protein
MYDPDREHPQKNNGTINGDVHVGKNTPCYHKTCGYNPGENHHFRIFIRRSLKTDYQVVL